MPDGGRFHYYAFQQEATGEFFWGLAHGQEAVYVHKPVLILYLDEVTADRLAGALSCTPVIVKE